MGDFVEIKEEEEEEGKKTVVRIISNQELVGKIMNKNNKNMKIVGSGMV